MAEHGADNPTSRSGTIEPLVLAARGGCASSFGELSERCRRYLLHVARRELHEDLRAKVAASDLVQQTLLQAQRNLIKFHGDTEEEFQAWLRQILLNETRGASRRFQRTTKRDIQREVSLEAVDIETGRRDNPESPSKLAVSNERMQAMTAALQRLPALYRQVIELRSLRLLSFGDIGRQMSRSPEAARSLWIRAVDRFRAETEGSDDSR